MRFGRKRKVEYDDKTFYAPATAAVGFTTKPTSAGFELAKAALRLNLTAMSSCHAATLFLLTADEQLWRTAEKGATFYGFQFGQMKLRNLSPDAYALYHAAKNLYTGKESMTVGELADPEIISGPLLTTIVNGILIARFGVETFKNAKAEVLQ